MLASLGKCMRLNYEELRAPDYSQIVSRQFEITSDPVVAGFGRKANVIQLTCRLEQQFKKEIEVAESGKIKKYGSEEGKRSGQAFEKTDYVTDTSKRWNIARFIISFTTTYCFT